jgi:two-component system phosphate regulon response regulator OmpR
MTDEAPHILVVDDDTRLRDLLKKYLSEQGFRVTTAGDAEEARAKLRSLAFDLLVLDIMMPGEDGLALTSSLREVSVVPILLLTARDDVADRIEGLEHGADDYLSKPFEPRELVLRIKAILRRIPQESESPTGKDGKVSFGDFTFDLSRQELRRGDKHIYLTSGETALLKALAEKAGVAVSRDLLGEQSGASANARTVDVQITRLRRKIEENPKYPRYLQTARGVGYILMAD